MAKISFSKLNLSKEPARVKVQIGGIEVEVVKYVEKKKSEIYSQPNASRSELLKLMHSGKL